MSSLSLAAAALNSTASSGDYHVLLIGDWGGDSDSEPTTKTQNDAAARMGDLTAELNTQFVLLLGDNFYHYGLTKDTADMRFEETFENCFCQESLSKLPFYAVVGNHDHRGDVQLQVDYTGKGSGRWQMPQLSYNIDKVLPDGKKLRIVMFDSVETSGQSYEDEDGNIVKATGPANLEASQSIFDWVEKSLAESDADYLFTAAHYPVYSGGRHGNVMISSALPGLMEKYHVQGHLAGHDHILQHAVDKNGAAHIVTGAGADNWYTWESKHFQDVDGDGKDDEGVVEAKFYMADDNGDGYEGGFVSMSFSQEGVRFTYYSNSGAVLYTSDVIEPREHNTQLVV